MSRLNCMVLIFAVAITALGTHPCVSFSQETGWVDTYLEGSPQPGIWDAKTPSIATELPDFDAEHPVTRGKKASRWQESTVLVKTKLGHGSGAVVSKDGWILTNYHVVATPVQMAAVRGDEPAQVGIMTCKATDRRTQRREEVLVAQVYRVDPIRDLALLKLMTLPDGMEKMSYFDLAGSDPKELDDCVVIGSPGGGPAWSVRPGKIIKAGSFPEDFTNWVVYGDDSGGSLDRTRFFGVVSNCPVSPGDSGGPILNDDGKLIGLTMGTSVNSSGGSIGYHVDLTELKKFLEDEPETPDLVPLDPWTAGLPFTVKTSPQIFAIPGTDGTTIGLQIQHIMQHNEQPMAEQFYFDFSGDVPDMEAMTTLDYLPTGLWGFEINGRFGFDAFVLNRFAEGILALGYTGDGGVVNEIRIDCDWNRQTDVVWKLDDSGAWTALVSPEALPLVADDRIGATGSTLINDYLDQAAKPELPPICAPGDGD